MKTSLTSLESSSPASGRNGRKAGMSVRPHRQAQALPAVLCNGVLQPELVELGKSRGLETGGRAVFLLEGALLRLAEQEVDIGRRVAEPVGGRRLVERRERSEVDHVER